MTEGSGQNKPSAEDVRKVMETLQPGVTTTGTAANVELKRQAVDPKTIVGTEAYLRAKQVNPAEVPGSKASLDTRQRDFEEWLATPEGQAFQRTKEATPETAGKDWRHSTTEVANWLNSDAGRAFQRLKGRVVEQGESQQ